MPPNKSDSDLDYDDDKSAPVEVPKKVSCKGPLNNAASDHTLSARRPARTRTMARAVERTSSFSQR